MSTSTLNSTFAAPSSAFRITQLQAPQDFWLWATGLMLGAPGMAFLGGWPAALVWALSIATAALVMAPRSRKDPAQQANVYRPGALFWTVPTEAWNAFATEQRRMEMEDARRLWILPTAAGSLGSLAGLFLAPWMAGLGIPLGLAIGILRWTQRRTAVREQYPLRDRAAHIVLSKSGVKAPGAAFPWDQPHWHLEALRWENRGILTFVFAEGQGMSRYWREHVVPVPAGAEADIELLVKELSAERVSHEQSLWTQAA